MICFFCCTGCYYQALTIASPSSDGDVRLRMKYNAAVLRSRRIQKQISDRSLSSLHGGHVHSEYGQPVDHRLAQGTADFHRQGIKSYQKPVTHAKDSTRGINVPSDHHHHYLAYDHHYPKPDTSKAKLSAATSRTDIDKGCHVGGRSHRSVTPHVYVTEKRDSDKSLFKQSPGLNNGSALASAVGIPPRPEEAPKLLLASGNSTDNIEIYATLRRRNRQQKAVEQHSLEASSHIRQRSSHSGISSLPGCVAQTAYNQAYPESRHTRRLDKTQLPPHDSLSHLKISWLVIINIFRAFL